MKPPILNEIQISSLLVISKDFVWGERGLFQSNILDFALIYREKLRKFSVMIAEIRTG
jgi:hypothetical protein